MVHFILCLNKLNKETRFCKYSVQGLSIKAKITKGLTLMIL